MKVKCKHDWEWKDREAKINKNWIVGEHYKQCKKCGMISAISNLLN